MLPTSERLHHALTRARSVNLVEEELPTLTALAELRRRQGRPEEARALLSDVWEAAERGGLSPGVVRRPAVRLPLGPGGGEGASGRAGRA
jgi:hypothetical protein